MRYLWQSPERPKPRATLDRLFAGCTRIVRCDAVQAPLHAATGCRRPVTAFTSLRGTMNRRSIMIASALLITAGVSTATAQVEVAPHISFGVLAGANFAKISGNDANGAKTRTGFVGGISADVHVAPHLGLEIDGLYSQQGAKENIEGQDVTLHLDYIQLPVLLRYRFPTHTPVRPFIVLGPSVGFRVKCELTASSDSATCDDNFSESAESVNAKSVDVSGTVGAGLGFKLGKEELSISARYNMGFTKAFQNSDWKNRVFSVLAGISF
jgi:hypothetical protein